MPRTSTYDNRVERSDGAVFDVDSHSMVPLHRIDNTFIVETSFDVKPPPYHGDHHTAYDWGHGGGSVHGDSPFVLHHHYDNPIDHLTSNYDFHQTQYLSKYRVPFSSSIVNGPRVANAQDQAITAALNSLKGAGANWGEDLGQLKQSVDGMARDAIRAAAFIKHMRRGQFSAAADALGISRKSFSHNSNRGKAIADYWLAYVYGWRPIAQSMYDTQAAIAAIVHRKSKTVEGTGHGRCDGSVSGVYYDKIHLSGDWLGSCKCTLKAEIENESLVNLNSVGLTNPVAIAWELVPFSFCVDWFVPIGNTLEALSAGFGLTWKGGFFSTITKEHVHMTRETGYETPWTDCVNGGDYSEEQFTFQRVALAGFPYARFYANLKPFSLPRAANALALVRQLT